MMKKTLFIAALTAALMSIPVYSNGSSEKEQTLTVYAGLLEEHAAAVCKAFQAKTGIKTNYVRMSGGEIFAIIKAENENPQANVWYGGGSLTFIEADNEGLLEHYISPEAKVIPAQFKKKKAF